MPIVQNFIIFFLNLPFLFGRYSRNKKHLRAHMAVMGKTQLLVYRCHMHSSRFAVCSLVLTFNIESYIVCWFQTSNGDIK